MVSNAIPNRKKWNYIHHLLSQIYWYRQGDLEPKFRNLIYYMLCSIVLLCICANLYFHDVGRDKQSNAL